VNHPVLTLHIQMTTHDAKAEESLRDSLVAWCDERQLFTGGRPEATLIYAPVLRITPKQIRQLRRLLDSCPDIHLYRLEFVEVNGLHSLALKAAAIEAFSQAQHQMATRMADCSEALAGLTHNLQNRWNASVTQDSKLLELRHAPAQIVVCLSHIDRISMPVFDSYADQSFSLWRMEELISNWLELHWDRVESQGDLSEGQWVAVRDDWRINLYAEPGTGLYHREVMLRYMQVCAS